MEALHFPEKEKSRLAEFGLSSMLAYVRAGPITAPMGAGDYVNC